MIDRNIPHTIPVALDVTGLSEDEAYFLLRFAGRIGYDKAIKRLDGSILYRARRWLIWVGGWEYSKLSQWDHDKPSWEPRRSDGRWKSPTPISFFGHFLTIQNRWIQARLLGGIFVFHKPDHLGGWGIYFSPNGTPQHPKARHFVDQRNQRRFRDETDSL